MFHHRDAAASAGDDDGILPELLHCADLHDPPGQGRGHHPPPAPSGVLPHGIALFLLQPPGLLLGVEGADGLGGILEGRVALLHHHLGGQGHHRHIPVALGQGVVQALLDVIADIPLAHGAAHIKGHGGHHVLGGLAGQDDPAHLGTVAVDHRHFVAGAADVGDALAGAAHHLQLGLGGGVTVFGLQGVSAQGDDDSGIAIHRDSSLAGEQFSMLSVPGFRGAMRKERRRGR